MKRLLDIVLSLLAVVILLLVFVVVAVAIKLSSEGPVIFRQERVSKPSAFYKFRAMKLILKELQSNPYRRQVSFQF
jgi:O-antigen biosynthesis protein WbqP